MKRLLGMAAVAVLGVSLAGCAMSDNGHSANASGSKPEPGITGESDSGPRTASYTVTGTDTNTGKPYLPGITGQSIVGPHQQPYPSSDKIVTARPYAPGITSESMNGPHGD